MAVTGTTEAVSGRFSAYLGELQEVFGQHGVPFGSPESLASLCERLRTPGLFTEDVSSILRSVVLRQGGSLPETDLIEILAAAAAGGSEALDPTDKVRNAYRDLVSFVAGVARRPWNVPPGQGGGPDSAPVATPTPIPMEHGHAIEVAAQPAAPHAPELPDTNWHLQETIARAHAIAFGETPPTAFEAAPELATRSPGAPALPTSSPEPAAVAPAQPEPLALFPPILGFSEPRAPRIEAELSRPAHLAEFANRAPEIGSSEEMSLVPADLADIGDMPEPPLAILPPPAASSAPLWLGAGCAVLLILAISVWTRWIYAKPAHAAAIPGPAVATSPVPTAVQAALSSSKPSGVVGPATPLPDAAADRRLAAAVRPSPIESAAEVHLPRQSASIAPAAALTSSSLPPATAGRQSSASAYEASPVRPSRLARSRKIRTVSALTNPLSPARIAQPSSYPPTRNPSPESAFAVAESSAPTETAAVVPPLEPWTKPTTSREAPDIRVSAGVMASHLLLSPDPNYPTLAKLTHIQGQVTVEAVISNTGEVVAAHVLSGHRLLRGAALSAVKERRYRPYVLDGRPVEVSTVVTVDFSRP